MGLSQRGELTTWRASLVTRGVVDRDRHCGRRMGLDICASRLESLGTTLEAISNSAECAVVFAKWYFLLYGR